MIVTLITQKNINSITLPDKVRGQFWLNDSGSGISSKLISIEAVDGEWVLKSNRKAVILDTGNKALYSTDGLPKNNKSKIKSVVLIPSGIYSLYLSDSDVEALIYTETNTKDRQIYSKYTLDKKSEVLIGRNEKNDIAINNEYISGSHAKLINKDNTWIINDKDYERESTNGTFVNGERVTKQSLNIGDVIYIMGFKLIMGGTFIAINNPDESVKINKEKLQVLINQDEIVHSEEDDNEDENFESITDYFYRSPRFRLDIETVEFKIDSPPQSPIGDEVPTIMVIGPSLTMGMASMTTAIFAINNAISNGNIAAATPSIIMSSSMLLGAVLWPILRKKFEKRRKQKKEALRQVKYKEYLTKMKDKISEETEKQRAILKENIVTISDCVNRIQNVKRNLWERSPGQIDFLELRVGTGTRQLSAKLTYSERVFSIEEDNLSDELYALCESPKQIMKVPITISLFDDYISGVLGDNKSKEFAKGLIFQIASLYSYDEVKIVFLLGEEKASEFEFTKWFPHVWSNDASFRFIATDNNEEKEVSAFLERELENRKELDNYEIAEITPYYVIFVLDKELGDRVEILKSIQTEKKNLHFSIVYFYDEVKNLPKECSAVVELEAGNGRIFDRNDISGKVTSFMPDIFLQANPDKLSIKLSNVHLDTLAGAFNLPKMLTFLEMFGVGKVEHLNVLSRWKENDPVKSLKAAVGVDTTGDLFQLDLHEKFHGPHGLVAGMTGSGKSEFIIAYILSLAVNYHPHEVAFILIDYKGGGMAKSFENLPHTAGIITNLDGAAIKRSLVSIESELKRRQTIFAEATKKIGVSNIDIYKYQRLYREGSVTEPLQHLFIISDEFAELKTQQPDFMTQLVSAARIGRSLGIHLILATQKPAGVVDDQIWSNSRFRVCLKVQERADSMDMLKRPDAAELKDTGRFYLQVGYNELFETGQSAWAGAPYHPADKVFKEKDDSVVFIDRNGRPIREVKPASKRELDPNPPKQLDVVTEYLCSIAEEENIKIKPLWMEPIPAMILLDSVINKYNDGVEKPYYLNPVVGEYDDPTWQRQCAMRIPISKEGNIIIYGAAGSGKDLFIDTIIYSLIANHTPDELNLYLLDFASESLRAFRKAPHVGDVLFSPEAEKIHNLFKMLRVELDHRVKLFADFGGDYNYYVQTSEEKIPNILVIISNFAVFSEMYEDEEVILSYLTREGAKYGIYFIFTSLGTGSVRFRMLQNFRQLYVLQMNDEHDYFTVVGKTDGLIPSKYKGRGLARIGDGLYEFQIAHVTENPAPYSFMQTASEQLNSEWKGKSAKKIPILPDMVDVEYLSEFIDKTKTWNIPIGVATNSLQIQYYPFGKSYMNVIMSVGDEASLLLYDLAVLYEKDFGFDICIFDAPQGLIEKDSKTIPKYQSADEIIESLTELSNEIISRKATFDDAVEKSKKQNHFEQKIVLINSMASIKNAALGKADEQLRIILEEGDSKYNITIIFSEYSKDISSISYDGWYKDNILPGNGIWIGNGISDQYALNPATMTAETRMNMDFGFGFVLQKGKAVKVKLLCSEIEGDNDE